MFGPDERGCVRGVGGGITKTELIASTVPMEQLRQEKLKTRALDGRVRDLEETVGQLKAGMNCNPSTSIASSQVRNSS